MTRLEPEARYIVGIGDGVYFCRPPDRAEQLLPEKALAAVFVETNDSGPWGMDVWWVLENRDASVVVTFPQGATGEDAVLARLQQLPGFEIQGMNSASNARFRCWPTTGSTA